jgi:hypothetical protein
VNKDELYAHPGWRSCTFEGAREELLLLGLRTTFREKLEWLEEAETLSLCLRTIASRTRSIKGCHDPSGDQHSAIKLHSRNDREA